MWNIKRSWYVQMSLSCLSFCCVSCLYITDIIMLILVLGERRLDLNIFFTTMRLFIVRVSKIRSFVCWLSERGMRTREEKNRNGHASITALITWIKVENKFFVTITKWKFIIREEMDNTLKWKEKLFVCKHILVKVSLQKKSFHKSKILYVRTWWYYGVTRREYCFISSAVWPSHE